MSQFKLERVLKANNQAKTINVLAHSETSKAVVVLSKPAFTPDEAQCITEGIGYKWDLVQSNDKYSQYNCTAAGSNANAIVADVICPASDKDIIKYGEKKGIVVRETPQMYKTVLDPIITKAVESDLQWVHNLVAFERPHDIKEEILFEDKEFIIVKDTKWNGDNLKEMYVLAIARSDIGRRVRSVRDLRGSDVPMLRRILENGRKVIFEKYNMKESEYRVYVHYFPSFWHFHIHFVALGSPNNEGSTVLGRSILLEDIIQNLEMNPLYYESATLTITTDVVAASPYIDSNGEIIKL